MSLLATNDIVIQLSGATSVYVEDRIVSCSKIHEYLEGDPGKMKISTFDVELDNADNFLWHYNAFVRMGADKISCTIYVKIDALYDIIWSGEGPAEVYNSADNTLKFTFEHDFSKFADGIYGPTEAPWDEYIAIDLFCDMAFGQMTCSPVYGIYMQGFSFMGIDIWLFDDFMVDKIFWKDYSIDWMTFIGDLCRTFGAVVRNRKNLAYQLIGRNSLLAQSADDVVPYIIGNINEHVWERGRKDIKIVSVNRGDPSDNQLIYGKSQTFEADEKILEIEANLMANMHLRVDEFYFSPYQELAAYIYNRYSTWFVRNTSAVDFYLSGLDWWVGDMLQFDDNYKVMVEETIKDLANRKTQIKGFKIAV